MTLRMIQYDLLKNKMISTAFVFFIGFAAVLLSLVISISINLLGSIDTLMEDDLTVRENTVISGKTFRIAGFLRKSQMNSSLASSKRFLVHPVERWTNHRRKKWCREHR